MKWINQEVSDTRSSYWPSQSAGGNQDNKKQQSVCKPRNASGTFNYSIGFDRQQISASHNLNHKSLSASSQAHQKEFYKHSPCSYFSFPTSLAPATK